MNIEQLILWVIKADRRLVIMETADQNHVIKASEIATKTGRSLQNISFAIRELEKYGLVRCITPNKSTWKRFIFTDKGMEIFEKLRNSKIQRF